MRPQAVSPSYSCEQAGMMIDDLSMAARKLNVRDDGGLSARGGMPTHDTAILAWRSSKKAPTGTGNLHLEGVGSMVTQISSEIPRGHGKKHPIQSSAGRDAMKPTFGGLNSR